MRIGMGYKPRTAILDCAAWGVLILCIAVIVFELSGTLTTRPVDADAFQNAKIALALARTGTFSQEIREGGPALQI
jgi:uncharacterized membrane protein (DUF441 family)